MRKRFSRLHIGLSHSGLAVAETHGWLRSQMRQIADITLPSDGTALSTQLNLALGSALAKEHGAFRAATFVLADDLVRLFIVNPPNNAARLQDCISAVHMRFQTLYGETSANWRIDADYHATLPFLACAVPNDLLDAINVATSQQSLTLVTVVPQFIACWNTWCDQLDDSAWLCIVNYNTLTLGAMQGQQITKVRSVPLPSAARDDKIWLADQVSKEAMRWNVPAPQGVHLYGDFPEHWINAAESRWKCTPLCSARIGTHDALLSPGMLLACTGLRW